MFTSSVIPLKLTLPLFQHENFAFNCDEGNVSHRVKYGFDGGCYSLFSKTSFDNEFKLELINAGYH
jgi:hypothetical protein